MKTRTPAERVKRRVVGEKSIVPRKKAKTSVKRSSDVESNNSDSNDYCFYNKVNKFSNQQEFTQSELKVFTYLTYFSNNSI